MKKRYLELAKVLFTVTLLTPLLALAQTGGVDAQTRDMLIEKLSRVYLNIAPKEPSKVAITLRLADLHAERARVNSMAELASGCTICNAGQEDRALALKYYTEVIDRVPEASVGKVLTQVGHLYELTGRRAESIATYEKILREQKAPQVVAEAHLSLAEVHFKSRNYAKAKIHFAQVLSIPEAGSKGLAAYRLAWSEFNEGNLEPAINGLVKVLKSKELLSRSALAGVIQVDKQFQEEVSRDLSTFLARKNVDLKDAELVYELSPEQAKLANVIYLASETERLGQVGPSIALWRFVLARQNKPEQRLESHVRLAQLQMEQRLLSEAIADFESALSIWPMIGLCQKGDCKELKARIRKFVLDWNHVEKKNPSEQLFMAYQSYLKVFPEEAEMNLWAGKVASDLKKYDQAIRLYQAGARLTKLQISKEPGNKALPEQLEGVLLSAIETAELSKEPAILNIAYESYLESSLERKKLVEVQYQKAHLIYDRGDYANAAAALRSVALLKEGGNLEVKKKAADLSLDALVLLKDDKRLESWALDYAKAFPADSKDFFKIATKSVLTQSATFAANAKGPEGLLDAWNSLARFDLSNAATEDKTAYYKNRLILAEKLGKFSEAREASDQLLRIPGLSPEDTRFALSRKAWLAELALDFDTALSATEKISGGELQGTQKLLKMAMLAELASKDPRPFYNQFLKDSKDDDKNAAIAVQLVRESKEPLKEITKNRTLLLKRPELLAELYLEIYGADFSAAVSKEALSTASVASTASGKVIARSLLITEISKLRVKIAEHTLDGNNQRKMAQTLKARVGMLEEIEKLAAKAIDSGDWTSQLLSLDLMAKQNDRFYQELLSLPMPSGLNSEEEQQYLMLLSQQAAPHQTKAADAAKKVEEFWQNAQAISQLDEAMNREAGPRRALLVQEIKALAEVAPESKKVSLLALAGRQELKKEVPTLSVLENARQQVRSNPMSRESIEKLLEIEKRIGRAPMIAYLEGRLASLDGTQGK